MELEYRKLTAEEIGAGLRDLNGWVKDKDRISKTFEFENYLDGVAFAAGVGYLAENLDHHPDLHIAWRKVHIAVNTHAVQGLSPYDLELARRIEEFAA